MMGPVKKYLGTLIIALFYVTNLVSTQTVKSYKLYSFLNKHGTLCIVYGSNDNYRFPIRQKVIVARTGGSLVYDYIDLKTDSTDGTDIRLYFLSSLNKQGVDKLITNSYEGLDSLLLRKKDDPFLSVITQGMHAYFSKLFSVIPKSYAENMRYPLTISKLKKLIRLVESRGARYLISQREEFREEDARSEYVSDLGKMFKASINKESLKELNKRYKDELDGNWNDDENQEAAITTLHAMRTVYILLLMATINPPLKLKILSPGQQSWFWFHAAKQPTSVMASRNVEQKISQLLADQKGDITLVEQAKLEPLVKKIPAGWSLKKFLAHFYKIHLMPRPENISDVLEALFSLFVQSNIDDYVARFKVSTTFALADNDGVIAPVIVLYLLPPAQENSYKTNAQIVVELLLKHTQEDWGTGITPRYNKKINNLLFIAQGTGSTKALYPDGLSTVFQPPEFAFYRPEWIGDMSLNFEPIIT